MKKSEIFIFVSIIILCFVISPNKVFGQEDNCFEDFERWVQENKNNKEEIVYTLSCDMVIDEEFRFYIPYDSNFTIDTNKYKILIKNHGRFIIDDNELNIIGEGGKEGVIHVETGGSISIGINNIIATDGTALYVEEGGDLYIKSSYESVEKIKANGKDAIGIYTENDIRILNKDIEVNGESAIGVYSKGDVEIEESSIKAYSSNKENGLLRANNKAVQSIVSESKKVYIIDNSNELIPAISEDSGYNIITCCQRGIDVFSEEIKVSKDDKIEDIKFPKDMVLETSSGNQLDIDVEWDFTDYYEKLKKEETFSITGKFKIETLNREKIVVNDDVVPILDISVAEKKPIDNLELDYQNTRDGYVAVLYFDMPYNANKVFVEYSVDGINWTSEEQEDIRDQAILFFEDFKLRCFRVRVEGGLKEGYSNMVFKPGFIMGGGDNQETPDDERGNDDIDGDRGGGGRDDPDRENDGLTLDSGKENDSVDEAVPEDSNSITDSNNEEKDNINQEDERNDKSDKEIIEKEKEKNNTNTNNRDNGVKNDDLTIINKSNKSLIQILKRDYEENQAYKNTTDDKKISNEKDTFQVGKFNNRLNSTSNSHSKTHNFQDGIAIGFGIVVSTMLFSIVAINPCIIKYVNKFIKYKK
ncbi:hypothetical protein QEW_3169 [Clostridioides difficile CD160]|nr:hypothetical protein QEW_3169 [Clostridioides difficile CD160]